MWLKFRTQINSFTASQHIHCDTVTDSLFPLFFLCRRMSFVLIQSYFFHSVSDDNSSTHETFTYKNYILACALYVRMFHSSFAFVFWIVSITYRCGIYDTLSLHFYVLVRVACIFCSNVIFILAFHCSLSLWVCVYIFLLSFQFTLRQPSNN